MTLQDLWQTILPFLRTWVFPALDILVVSTLLVAVALAIHRAYRGSRTLRLLRGLFLILFLFGLSWALDLRTLKSILSALLNYGIIALVVVFQPEVRRLLVRMGENRLLSALTEKERALIQNEIIEAITYLSRRKTGALIVIRQSDHLGAYADTGVRLDARLSSRLIISLFHKKSLLHDGALIINHDRVEAAGCILPLTDNPALDRSFGTRHRAALGISEASDAVAVVISEQTGKIAFCAHGEIETVPLSQIRDRIESLYGHPPPSPPQADTPPEHPHQHN